MNFFQRTYAAWKEILNFFFIGRVIRRNKKTEKWKSFKLRKGYVNQIYTIVNLRKEDMGEEDSIRKMRIIEKTEKLNRYIEDLNLAEIVYPEYTEIPDTRSWLITYWPIWNYFSIWRFLFWILGLSFITHMIIKHDLIEKGMYLFNQITYYVESW